MSLEHVALARQPILDRAERLVAYELLFRRLGERSAIITDGMGATAHVLNTSLAEIGLDALLGGRLGFVNVEAGFLCSDYVLLLPPEQVVLELLEDIDAGPATVARCIALKEHGFTLALDDFDGRRGDLAPLLELADIVKVDLTLVAPAELEALVARLRRPGRRLLAEKVETAEEFTRCRDLGFDLFQGYFFARPQTMHRKRANPGQIAVLRLYAMITADADTDTLEAELKRQPALSVALLRLVNSAASGVRQRISSIRQAVVLLGRSRLGAWLQLLLYLSPGARSGPLLLQVATVRARLLELMAQKLRPDDRPWQDAAFMTGILSLVDVLLGMPAAEFLAELHVVDDVRRAVVEREGELGAMLTLAMALERDDPAAIQAALDRLPACDHDTLLRLQLAAAAWANEVTATVAGPNGPP